MKAFQFRLDDGIHDFSIAKQDVVKAWFIWIFCDSDPGCGVSLRIGINQEHA